MARTPRQRSRQPSPDAQKPPIVGKPARSEAAPQYWVTDRGAIRHGGKRYEPGAKIPLSTEQAKPLLDRGAVKTTDIDSGIETE